MNVFKFLLAILNFRQHTKVLDVENDKGIYICNIRSPGSLEVSWGFPSLQPAMIENLMKEGITAQV